MSAFQWVGVGCVLGSLWAAMGAMFVAWRWPHFFCDTTHDCQRGERELDD